MGYASIFKQHQGVYYVDETAMKKQNTVFSGGKTQEKVTAAVAAAVAKHVNNLSLALPDNMEIAKKKTAITSTGVDPQTEFLKSIFASSLNDNGLNKRLEDEWTRNFYKHLNEVKMNADSLYALKPDKKKTELKIIKSQAAKYSNALSHLKEFWNLMKEIHSLGEQSSLSQVITDLSKRDQKAINDAIKYSFDNVDEAIAALNGIIGPNGGDSVTLNLTKIKSLYDATVSAPARALGIITEHVVNDYFNFNEGALDSILNNYIGTQLIAGAKMEHTGAQNSADGTIRGAISYTYKELDGKTAKKTIDSIAGSRIADTNITISLKNLNEAEVGSLRKAFKDKGIYVEVPTWEEIKGGKTSFNLGVSIKQYRMTAKSGEITLATLNTKRFLQTLDTMGFGTQEPITINGTVIHPNFLLTALKILENAPPRRRNRVQANPLVSALFKYHFEDIVYGAAIKSGQTAGLMIINGMLATTTELVQDPGTLWWGEKKGADSLRKWIPNATLPQLTIDETAVSVGGYIKAENVKQFINTSFAKGHELQFKMQLSMPSLSKIRDESANWA